MQYSVAINWSWFYQSTKYALSDIVVLKQSSSNGINIYNQYYIQYYEPYWLIAKFIDW